MTIKAYKFHLNDEHKQVVMLLLKAREIGRNAAYAQLNKLQHNGPKWNVVDEMDKGKVVGQMLDVCGFASMQVPGRSKIVKAFKKLGVPGEHNNYGGMNIEYILEDEHMRISKAYDRGYNLNLGLNIGRQELSVNEAGVEAASNFLNSKGLECNWNSRID